MINAIDTLCMITSGLLPPLQEEVETLYGQFVTDLSTYCWNILLCHHLYFLDKLPFKL